MRSQRNRVVHLVFAVFLCFTYIINLQGQANPLSSFYAPNNNIAHVFYVKNAHVFEGYTSSSSWQSQDLTAMASNGVPVSSSGSDLTSFYANNNASPAHAFFEDGAGHIHELYSDSVGAWHDMDLASASGGATAMQKTPLASFYMNATSPEHVFFLDSTQHVHELWSDSSGTWHDHDLTVIANGQAVWPGTGRIVGFVGNNQSPEHVFYTGVDFHVHELYLDVNDANWHDLDLTLMTGSYLNEPPSSLTGFYAGGTSPEHIFYQDGFGTNGGGSVHELYSDSTGTWHEQNLTSMAGSSTDAGTLISFYTGSEHVVYITTDGGDIREMFSDSLGAWHDRLVIQGYPGYPALPNYGLTGFIGSSSSLAVFNYAYVYPAGSPFIEESSTNSSSNWVTSYPPLP